MCCCLSSWQYSFINLQKRKPYRNSYFLQKQGKQCSRRPAAVSALLMTAHCETEAYFFFFFFCIQQIPSVSLRRAFVKMSTSPEAFLSLRSHFASSHALMCISHWILGIGDRHLSNFMINKETGGMVGIDFGHAFGSATQVCFLF